MLHLVIIDGLWHVRFADGTESDVRRLFGTDTIPTPFGSTRGAEAVKSEIERRNPGATVTVDP